MKHPDDIVPVITLPEPGTWDFGGHPYALEPLALPRTHRPRTPTTLDRAPRAGAWHPPTPARPGPAGDDPAPDLVPHGTGEVDRFFWFRWITGHQATFALWQVLAATLDEALRPAADEAAHAQRSRFLVRGYSLMLLYASSPPRDIYERVVRAPMARQHVNLSGAWARDYGTVRALVRGRLRLGHTPESSALSHECALNEAVHEGIATKVVPSGVSLLQSPRLDRGTKPMSREALLWLYDGIFLTTRAPVTYEDVVRQLLRRLHVIFLDVTTNGLYPAFAPSGHDEPPALRTDEVEALKQSFAGSLLDIAEVLGVPRNDDACPAEPPPPGGPAHLLPGRTLQA